MVLPGFDLAAFHHLRRALWTPGGNAAVMVGSGFSMNAVRRSSATKPMPRWSDLTRALSQKLYPLLDPRAAPTATSEALRLAQEFAYTFGRTELDTLLLDEIPDLDYEPGKIHQLLLRLPWTDVLTTNYDTLLERASESVVLRSYEVVHTAADIPGRGRPRIVKLHGSFPSVRPWIITEDDFRHYPRTHAAMINLAQQVIMEKVVCLIGFSGDDPNFLTWTGWVRDHLGDATQNIYLCGIFDTSAAQLDLLRRRHITVIDLSGLDLNPARRYELAYEWLLLSLEAGEPLNPLSWPRAVAPARTAPSPGLPALIA